MSKRAQKENTTQKGPASLDALLGRLHALIAEARRQALRAVDAVQVRTCWEVGHHIIEFEQRGSHRAEYGARLLSRLAEKLTADFGKGFDVSNLRYMRLFYQSFPICDALRHELSWTHPNDPWKSTPLYVKQRPRWVRPDSAIRAPIRNRGSE